jgi:DNA-binding transcriptional MocR family regulator
MKRYRVLADELAESIRAGTLRPGERMPSVRQLIREHSVSPATAMRAYEALEMSGFAESRPRSGHFVGTGWQQAPAEPRRSRPPVGSTRVEISELVFQILEGVRDREVVPLGSAFPSPALFPWARLARHLGSSARRMDPWSTVSSLPPGMDELRHQIARRYLSFGCRVAPDEIVITSGALEALNLTLQTVTRAGDCVAIEAPTFYACLQAIEQCGLKAIEIPTDPREGVDLAALGKAIARHAIKACWFMTTFQNPLGATLPEEKKRELVRLLARHEIPLIEDDAYAELHFGAEPVKPAKAFDEAGLVLHSGSFSKCLAPGYRLGWVAAGRFVQRLQRRKITSTLATSIPIQHAISQFLSEGGYDAHLRRLRRALHDQQAAALQSLRKHFPDGYRVVPPAGGYFLWIELPHEVDALEVHRLALRDGISIAPGPMFSARREFRCCIRLNTGHPWTVQLDSAVATLGRILSRARAARTDTGR